MINGFTQFIAKTPYGKKSHGEVPLRWSVLMAKCPYGEMSVRRSGHKAKFIRENNINNNNNNKLFVSYKSTYCLYKKLHSKQKNNFHTNKIQWAWKKNIS